jgi:uncharacterized protein (TIGR03085 family)
MSLASLARSERADLCDLMVEVGPDAPTLNEGWTVLDLAAHLVAREHDLWGGPGIVLGGPMAKLTDLAMARRRRQGLERLVSILRRGEPLWFRLAPAGTQLNEFFIHHEDVRRPNGHPRVRIEPTSTRPSFAWCGARPGSSCATSTAGSTWSGTGAWSTGVAPSRAPN